MSESRAHAHSVIKEASDRLAQEAEERNKALAARLAEQIKAGETRIGAAKDKALANVRDVAVDVAGSVFARLVGAAADAARLDSAVAAALEEHGK